jgi:probable HAF family extracellular repeat protein
MQDLGAFSGGQAVATGVSADGTVVVGQSIDRDRNSLCFRWTQATGMVDLATLVSTPQFQLAAQPAISADSRVITAQALNTNGGNRVSVVMQMEAACKADFNGDGQIDFFDYLDFVDAFAVA